MSNKKDESSEDDEPDQDSGYHQNYQNQQKEGIQVSIKESVEHVLRLSVIH